MARPNARLVAARSAASGLEIDDADVHEKKPAPSRPSDSVQVETLAASLTFQIYSRRFETVNFSGLRFGEYPEAPPAFQAGTGN